MRLLQLEDGDRLTLTEDLMADFPPYAILSHTWGGPGDEVTLQDIKNNEYRLRPSLRKILFCGEQAHRDGLSYFWVDSCCIDRTSSAELTEAVNSMYRWYQNAQKCYVYLSDFSDTPSRCDEHDRPSSPSWLQSFQTCRWNTRGWTPQELIAPPVVEFYSRQGQKLGDKSTLEEIIHNTTGIPIPSLLGLVGVSMPVIYGEGEENAYIRLYKEVIQHYHEYSGAYAKSRDSQGNSLLAQAAKAGRGSIIRMLLDNGADIELGDIIRLSPLSCAAKYGHEEVVRILLARGANIESKDEHGMFPLTRAAQAGQEGTIRLLLASRANIESKDDGGWSALAWAADRGHDKVVQLLLDSGANIESKDNNGWSPLTWAAERGQEGAVRILLARGADIESKDENGLSPLAWAAEKGHEGVVRILLDNSAHIKTRPDSVSPLALARHRSHKGMCHLKSEKIQKYYL
ncbi:ankyrin repeat-containing domain protein [Xylariaceae sp. FL0255]|nr:ankyrin repeat-containing domain protein [Xylariaceae sp. FL0255]